MSGVVQDVRLFKEHSSAVTVQRAAPLWLLFFLICMGLGSAPLNRYDPGKFGGASDVTVYRNIVMGLRPPSAPEGSGALDRLAQSENYYRVLVPYVAKPFYWLVRDHLGTWDPAIFALLLANSIFTATTACLLVAIGCRLKFGYSTGLLGATLYLLNYCVANLNLVGLVDSAEGCFVMIIVWSLLQDYWYLLPIWGILGALAKETFVPLSAMFVFGWWIAELRRSPVHLARLAWAVASGLAGIITVTIAMSSVADGLVWPWELAAYLRAGRGLLAGLRGCILDHAFFYVFVWLLPLGLIRLRRLPRPWVLASAAAFCGALALGSFNNAGGNTTRGLFNVSGPLLSLSAAVFLSSSNNKRNMGPGDSEPGQA
jgi:hypothetical protein